MTYPPRILFAAGGTGGHVYPALAVADAIRTLEPEAAIAFAGTRERMEWEAVPKAGYAIHPITVSGLQRQLTVQNLKVPFKLMKGLQQSWRLVADFDADVAVGTGGFVALPVLMAAHLRKRPILLQEQNAFAGLTNRMLGGRATRIHIAFEEAKKAFPAGKCVMSGNPTRRMLTGTTPQEGRAFFGIPEDARVLFVFGGSLGAQALNTTMEEHLADLLADEQVHVIWQTGPYYYDRLKDRIAAHPRLQMKAYIDAMDKAYAAANVVLCRSGAITCSELMMTGTAAVLVPSPNVAEDHQTRNAESMVRASAAIMLPENELSSLLRPTLMELLPDIEQQRNMGLAARGMAHPDAAEQIARDVLQVAQQVRKLS